MIPTNLTERGDAQNARHTRHTRIALAFAGRVSLRVLRFAETFPRVLPCGSRGWVSHRLDCQMGGRAETVYAGTARWASQVGLDVSWQSGPLMTFAWQRSLHAVETAHRHVQAAAANCGPMEHYSLLEAYPENSSMTVVWGSFFFRYLDLHRCTVLHIRQKNGYQSRWNASTPGNGK